jgi:Sporulation and spore germination
MSRGRVVAWTLVAVTASALVGAAFVVVPRWYADTGESSPAVETPAVPATAKIKARLFYVSEDGMQLMAVEREVPFGDGTLAQAQRIVEAQLEPPAAPYMSTIPAGTRLRAIYIDSEGEAFVDLSAEASSAHSGGTLDEILTVYSIVNAVTMNLPAVKAVQILVDGREVDTLAGHVDLRQPLPAGASWVQAPGQAGQPPAAAANPSDQAAPTTPRGAPITK